MRGSAIYGFVALAIVMLSIGTAMAMWSETLKMNTKVNTGEVDWGMSSLIYLDGCGLPSSGIWCPGATCGWDWNTSGQQMSKDVGCTEVHLYDTDGDGDYDVLNVTLHNTYPSILHSHSVQSM